MSLRDKVQNTFSDLIIFLKGEEKSDFYIRRPIFTKEEMQKIYGIKKDLRKFDKVHYDGRT